MKPILATTLSGLFIKSEPWKKAHVLWFERAAEELDDASVKDYANTDDYFKHVDEVMQRLYPELSDKERTIKAREMYFNSVYEYILINPRVVNKEVIQYFASLKDKFRLALVTTNAQKTLEKILSLKELSGLFDIIEASEMHEKDDKVVVFDRFVKRYGKPGMYIGGNRKDSFDYCKKNNIPCIFANLEAGKDLEGVETVHGLEELKEKIKGV
ncbi:hypothetical protein KY348_01675 [Candidatus Woesearchaeota archaeon]|nr:hypothetical protein [Candidatus Woesearchaeota archaeon]